MAIPEASAWKEDFQRWAMVRCLYCPRDFGGIGALHRDFCDWCINHHSVPCVRAVFEQLVQMMGLLVADGLVSGLILKEDLAWANAVGEPTPPLSGGRSQED